MKTLVFSFIIITTAACAQKNHSSQAYNGKIDSIFTHHFKVLDSYLKDRSTDSSGQRISAIHFMEIHTKIQASGTGSYIGKTSFSKENLDAWHKWYVENKDNLVWDAKTQTIWKEKE